MSHKGTKTVHFPDPLRYLSRLGIEAPLERVDARLRHSSWVGAGASGPHRPRRTPMPVLDSYLFFNGNCAEAMRFYERTLGGKLEALMTYGDSPEPEKCPAGAKD